jgi:hypothetical protein
MSCPCPSSLPSTTTVCHVPEGVGQALCHVVAVVVAFVVVVIVVDVVVLVYVVCGCV